MLETHEIIKASEKIELLSEDVQEIMGQVPNWIVRWGITVILLIIFLLVGGSFVFNYPDVISSTVIITSENPTASIVTIKSGRIDNLFVQNGNIVKKGEILASIENTANFHNVLDLKCKLNDFEGFFKSPLNSKSLFAQDYYSLGQIQPAFSNFKRLYDDYLSYINVNIGQKKIEAIRNQKKDYESYCHRLKTQAINQEKSLELTRKQFMRDSSLFHNGVTALAEYEKSEQVYLQVKNSYQGLLASVANNLMIMNQLRYQIIDLESQQEEQIHNKINTLRESYDNLKAIISDWEKTYLLISPIDGKISINRFWSKNQFVNSGETVFTIVPAFPQRIIGRAKIPIAGSGKIERGQRAIVRLDNFPCVEYGILEGKIESISLIPETNQNGVFYTVEMTFPYGLITNYKINLPFNQEMYGSAEIITRNLSLFDRMINPIKSSIMK